MQLKTHVKSAPAALQAVELNVKLAEQADDRVAERIKLKGDRARTDQAVSVCICIYVCVYY